jgi:hypothetical protein
MDLHNLLSIRELNEGIAEQMITELLLITPPNNQSSNSSQNIKLNNSNITTL